MATKKDLEELLSLPESFPFLTVYLDLGPQSRANRSYEVVLRKRFSELAALVERGSEDEQMYWTAVRAVWDYINNRLPGGVHGAALFVAPRLNIQRDYPVAYRFETEAVLDTRPYVRPLAHVVEEHEHHLVVYTSADQAAIYMVHLRAAQPVAKLAEVHSEVPAKTAQGGWSQKRFQWHRRDHIQRHLKSVAEAIVSLDQEYDCAGIILLGQEPNISELRKHLPQRVLVKIVAQAPEPTADTEEEILERVLPLLRVEERFEEASVLERVIQELARGGLAAAGPQAVTAALTQSRVDIFVISQEFRAQGLRCRNCGALMTKEAAADHCIYC
ncbi:MAG: hypothetical protein H5T86_16750, partial [Armatimonadetes bacterium]|nr:hypothetical protein [Armatimonadota bacterium]